MFGSLADLTISLTASLIHIDNLLLKLDPVNESYEEIWLANEQMGQALKSLIKLRELSHYQYGVREPFAAELSHDLNDCLTILLIFNDLICHYNGDKQLYELINLTYNSINNLIVNYLNNNSKKPAPARAKYLESIRNNVNNNELRTNTDKLYKILYIEDNNDIRKIVSIALSNKGYIVMDCSDAESALELFSKECNFVKLSIIDIKLPKMDGTELANNLLNINPDLNIIFLTGCDEKYLRESLFFNNSYLLLLKPLRLDKLIKKVEWAMSMLGCIIFNNFIISWLL